MDEIELEKQTYEKVVSLIQSGEKAKALQEILPEANEDPELAQTVFTAIEKALVRESRSSSKKEKELTKEKKKEASDSSQSSSSPTTSILLPSDSGPSPKRKSALRGDHKGIQEIELEKETFHQVVDLIKAGKRDQALDLILEEANRSEALAKKVLAAIERTLADEKPAVKVSKPSSEAPASPVTRRGELKEEKRQAPATEPADEKPLATGDELDSVADAKKENRGTSPIPLLFRRILGHSFYGSGKRPRKVIWRNFAICLIVGLAIGYFVFASQADGPLSGSNSIDQETLNFVAVALCPLLANDLDLHAGQRNFCSRKRNRFAYYLYEESRKIDGLDTIRGPFSEETLEEGLFILGKQIRAKLNRSQRKQFLNLYESGQWKQVDIVNDEGRFRLEYPTYGNAPGFLSLSVASRQ